MLARGLLLMLVGCQLIWEPDEYRAEPCDADCVDASVDSNGTDGDPSDTPTDVEPRDAGDAMGIVPVWIVQVGGSGDDVLHGVAMRSDDVVVGGRVEPGADIGATPIVVPTAQGVVAILTASGDLVESHVFVSDQTSEITDVTSDNSTVYAAGHFFGELPSGERSSGAFDGWVGQLSGGLDTLATWGGANAQRPRAIDFGGGLLVGGHVTETLVLSSGTSTPDDRDGVVVEHKLDGTIGEAQLYTGVRVGDDEVRAVTHDDAGRMYGGGRLGNAEGFDMFVAQVDGPLMFRAGTDALSTVTSLASPARGDVCAGGHYLGTLDLGDGDLSRSREDAAFVQCFSGSDVEWVRRFDGPSLDRITALDAGAGVLIAGGAFREDLDLGLGVVSATDEDGFLVVLDPEAPSPSTAYFHISGPGNIAINSLAIRPQLDGTRIYVVGTFSDRIDLLGGLTTRGGNDGFVAAFDLVR